MSPEKEIPSLLQAACQPIQDCESLKFSDQKTQEQENIREIWATHFRDKFQILKLAGLLVGFLWRSQ